MFAVMYADHAELMKEPEIIKETFIYVLTSW